MEVGTIKRLWRAACEATGRFLDEAAFRTLLAWDVALGRVPVETKKRYWNRRFETPVLVELYSWVDARRIASILVWPSLETEEEDAAFTHMQRTEQVKQAILRGATEMAWSMRLEVDYGLAWDSERKCWVEQDGFAYDGERATDRQPSGQSLRDPGRGQNGAVFLPLGCPVPEENEEAS